MSTLATCICICMYFLIMRTTRYIRCGKGRQHRVIMNHPGSSKLTKMWKCRMGHYTVPHEVYHQILELFVPATWCIFMWVLIRKFCVEFAERRDFRFAVLLEHYVSFLARAHPSTINLCSGIPCLTSRWLPWTHHHLKEPYNMADLHASEGSDL